MSLSIEDCASQLDLYAASKEQQAADQKAHAKTLSEGLYRSLALMMADPHAASAFSLRFAATFLRSHAVMRWTKERPTVPGIWWYRPAGMVLGLPVRLVIEDRELVWREDGYRYQVSLAGGHWAGPLVQPSEPLEAFTPTPVA